MIRESLVYHHFHIEHLRDFRYFSTYVAISYNPDTFPLDFFCWEFFKLFACIKIFLYYHLMQHGNIQIRRCFQQGFKNHVCSGTTVKTRCVHQW